ncbi:MAG: hypothetical protein HKN20_02135, partial [Gemmatimonadetes bacterium]|nr:hypothetical protein [Gemmatimonadota bacterium]
TLPWNEQTAADLIARFDELDQTTYQTILLRVVDHIDHLLDGGLMYSAHSGARLEEAQVMLEPTVTLAEKLGYPELGVEARALTESSARMKVPPPLQNQDKRKFSRLVAPRTHQIAPIPKLRQILWRGLGIRKAIRSLFQSGKNS